MVGDQVLNELGYFRAVDVDVLPGSGAARRALVGLFAGDEFGIGKNGAMLEVVNAERDGFRPGDGAEMAGELEVVGVGGGDSGGKLRAGDVHVGLEGGHAFGGPVVDHAGSVIGTGELVHLGKDGGRAFKVGSGGIERGPGHEAGVDAVLDHEVGVGLQAAGGAHSGDASSQVEARRGVGDLRDKEAGLRDVAVHDLKRGRVGVVEMVVHAHKAGNDGVAGAVEDLGAGGDGGGGCRPDGLDLAVGDDNGLVVAGSRAGAVDDADVVEDEDGGVDGDEVVERAWIWTGRRRALRQKRRRREAKRQGEAGAWW